MMRALPGTIHVNKIAAASRQLSAAIRMFFAPEDELAIHTVASAAFRILRDVSKKRGKHFTAEVFRNGIYNIARQYADGKLPKEKLKLIENTEVMVVIKDILADVRAQGEAFDRSRIDIRMNTASELRAWPSKAANFLKHADRDAEEHLSVDEINNEHVLMGACCAYLELMRTPTPEIMAFFAFSAVKNEATTELGEEVHELSAKLQLVDASERLRICAQFIRDTAASV
jgi:hypothetical protein